ncbi:MAG: BrnA antitoxin family protein [Rhodobacteraceae bacterium]|nr:BrnA antitoxin family protein [Paracoccaceae bacterium]
MTRQTKSEREKLAAYHGLATTMRGLEEDLRWGLEDSLRLPHAWREIATRPAIPQKRLVTIRLDEDVLAFFRAMGRGHLTRINAVLRTFMLARLAGLIPGPDEVQYTPSHEEEMKALAREILDAGIAEAEAREAREKAAEEKKALEGRRAFRDYKLGKGK